MCFFDLFIYTFTIVVILLAMYKWPEKYFGNVPLYTDNGNRIFFEMIGEEVLGGGKGNSECTVKELVPCKMGVGACVECVQVLATCVHFDNDIELMDDNGLMISIPANDHPDDGYCLFLLDDRSEKKCTKRNGGKWIISKVDGGRYTYKCFCSESIYFTNETIGGDCTRFQGCKNGTISNPDYSYPEEIMCLCNTDYYLADGAPPSCKKSNIFYSSKVTFMPLDHKYIADEYWEYVDGEHVRLPNPCIIDAYTGEQHLFDGEIILEDGIAYCVSKNPHFITLRFNDDYLRGNGGKFANGIMRITTAIDVNNETIYEFAKNPERPLSGRRIPYEDLTIKLPYLEKDSGNMGGGGRYYSSFPSISDVSYRMKVFVYDAEIPKMKRPTFDRTGILSYIPVFMPQGIESRSRVFNGMIPYRNVINNIDGYGVAFYPTVPVKDEFDWHFGRTGLFEGSGLDMKDGRIRPYYVPHMLDNYNHINYNTTLFTGIVLSEFVDPKAEGYYGGTINVVKPLTAGSENLTRLFIKWVNPDFEPAGHPDLKFVYENRSATLLTTDMAPYFLPENFDGIEAANIAKPPFEFTHIQVNTLKNEAIVPVWWN